jgi:hypothetical protein
MQRGKYPNNTRLPWLPWTDKLRIIRRAAKVGAEVLSPNSGNISGEN